MKSVAHIFRHALPALLCCIALARTAGAQEEDAARTWVRVAPPNEAFAVSMPETPVPVAAQAKYDALSVTGQRYSVRREKAEYTVWSLKAASLPAALGDDREDYLDQCAEIAWNLIIKPKWLKLKQESLTYITGLSSGDVSGRIYHVNLDRQKGTAHIYAVGSQIYIVAAAGAPRMSASVEEFVRSFTLNRPAPKTTVSPPKGGRVDTGEGVGTGSGGYDGAFVGDGTKGTDYGRVFGGREVTQKVQLLSRPEPPYTDAARKFGVTGKVRVRFILRPSGEVSNITPLTRLPHGLTRKAVEAARRIKFTPAMKDGRAVAQYGLIEYNFNIY